MGPGLSAPPFPGEPWNLPALRERFPEWDIRRRGLAAVTAVLRDDRRVAATHGPVSVAVMGCVLSAWKVEAARPGPR